MIYSGFRVYRRWKVLFPDEVPLRQAAWKMQKAVLVSNFVDRESERPLISPSDFCISSSADLHAITDGTKRRRYFETVVIISNNDCRAILNACLMLT